MPAVPGRSAKVKGVIPGSSHVQSCFWVGAAVEEHLIDSCQSFPRRPMERCQSGYDYRAFRSTPALGPQHRLMRIRLEEFPLVPVCAAGFLRARRSPGTIRRHRDVGDEQFCRFQIEAVDVPPLYIELDRAQPTIAMFNLGATPTYWFQFRPFSDSTQCASTRFPSGMNFRSPQH